LCQVFTHKKSPIFGRLLMIIIYFCPNYSWCELRNKGMVGNYKKHSGFYLSVSCVCGKHDNINNIL
jgi:hypothetical protein